MIKQAIARLSEGRDLSFYQAKAVFGEIFHAKASPSQIAAFLISLKIKGEKEKEIWAAAEVIRKLARKIDIIGRVKGKKAEAVVDTCGTGGSGVNKFNISTAAAFVVSSGGVKVAKHGNRAMSSRGGSADVLEELGIKIDVSPQICWEAIKKVGIGFLYAPLYHPALGKVAKIRKEISVRTIFNILGPLCNPVSATHQLLGVYAKELVPVIARVLGHLGVKKAFIVHSRDLKDEVSLGSDTFVSFLNNRKIRNFSLRPSDFGLRRVGVRAVGVRSVKESAGTIRKIFEGEKGPCRDVVLANAGCCFYILGRAKSLRQGVNLAAQLIDEGKVKRKLLELKNFLIK